MQNYKKKFKKPKDSRKKYIIACNFWIIQNIPVTLQINIVYLTQFI